MNGRHERSIGRGIPLAAILSTLAIAMILAVCSDAPVEPDPVTPDPPDPVDPGPDPPNPTDPSPNLFARYVALGNSITAGVESHGLNDSTQVHAYPVLLAEQADASFPLALARRPGCPAPLVGPSPLTSERVGGADESSCAGFDISSGMAQNLAFPGFKIADVFSVPDASASEGMRQAYDELLGSRTVIDVMIELEPSLVSVWLGNNDALSAALGGNLDHLTPASEFRSRVNALAAALADDTDAEDVIWISVVDPQLAPAVQPGAYFWGLAQDTATAELLTKPVADNCAPFVDGEPNPLAANLVSFFADRDPNVSTISCARGAPYVLSAEERSAIGDRVEEFNAAIRDAADANGWIYVDANALIEAELADPDRVRKCQDLLTASENAFASALRESCPMPNAPNFFGSLLSFDGVHPSAEGHRLIGDALADALQAKHGEIF